MTTTYTAGSIVACRDRQWVVLPSDIQEIIRLRPLSGNEAEICGIFTDLEGEFNKIDSAQFPLPDWQNIQDHTAGKLLLNAAKLSLRNGANSFRCLGRLSVTPRPYQIVPLLMALRLETIRLLIADDVGIGKTIEAGLIAREMLDRGEIKRLGVLCPPALCDQWQKELKQKFNIDAVVIRSGTVAKLERNLPSNSSHIFSYYPHIIVSLDYAKSDRRRASFLAHCPDLVIVDEAHTASNRDDRGTTKQQRYQLVQQISEKQDRHLVLLTATPHSGISQSFLSLLGLINTEFANLDLDNLSELQRKELARHFVQRRRADVRQWMDKETPFPERESLESAYQLSKEYRELFEQVYNLARGLIKEENNSLSYAQKRGRYWSALAIIRCVMSSPAAAVATLSRQLGKIKDTEVVEELDEELSATYVYDETETEKASDINPTSVIEQVQQTYSESQKRKLREFVKKAEQLKRKKDSKLQQVIGLVRDLREQGYQPIIWCRYIATANYVAEALKNKYETKKNNTTRVIAITGEQSEDEREIRLQELKDYPQRIMVATDCLSEGVNLQEHFSAVIHYDLPWNPNRLEQREGRVDRYGQTATKIKCIVLYGQDNPIDGAVLDVLIRKANKIHRALGISVPVPMESNSVQKAVFKSLFEKVTEVKQLSLFPPEVEQLTLDLVVNDAPIVEVHQSWDRAVEREKQNRTRFAQKAIKPEEIKQELEESDRVLGSQDDVKEFVLDACARLNCPLVKKKQGWLLSSIPQKFKFILGSESRLITFDSPALEGVEYIGRNHPIVEGLARYLLEQALTNSDSPIASRCGFTVTDAVDKPITILLLRLRHLLSSPRNQDLLAEECLIRAFTGSPSNPQWLSEAQAIAIWQKVEPLDDYPLKIMQNRMERVVSSLPDLQGELKDIGSSRAEVLQESYQRVRAITKEGAVKVKPQLPMDILGVYWLQPL
ncbi:MAG: helicase-related protein [Xenococcaceae cyanobacterium MO_207.B15]|nr:helicase-related protein [Xenococcaceae cyanobacterium MO_207.B15]